MSQLHFILGTPRSGKTRKLLEEIKIKCHEQPVGAPIFIITPDQMTFHMEYQLLMMGQSKALVRANALSFTRLAHRILSETGGLARFHLDEVGKAMLLQKIMSERTEELGIFSKYVTKTGFIQKMDELFTEFKHHNVDPVHARTAIATGQTGQQVKEKVERLLSLYEAFNETVLTQYLTTEDYFNLLKESIQNSETIQNSEIYIDGYHNFNPLEHEIIATLIKYAKKVTVLLTIDQQNNHPLYMTTKETFTKINEAALALKLKPTVEQLAPRLTPSPALNHLSSHFLQSGEPTNETAGLALFVAPTKRMELEVVARRIHQLVKKEQLHYSNIAVYGANLEEEGRLIETVFTKHGIPFFMDMKEAMISHPVIKGLYELHNVFRSNWRNTTLLSLFKTGLFMDTSHIADSSDYAQLMEKHLEEIDQLENYILARNIRKSDWTSGATWKVEKFPGAKQTDEELALEEKITTLKNRLALPLIYLEQQLKDSSTAVDYATSLFEFLEVLEIPQKKLSLMSLSAHDHHEGKMQKLHEQVWAKLLVLFEQIVEVSQKDPLPYESFMAMFRSGLENMTYTSIPATLDSVQVGNITRARYQLSSNFNDPHEYGIAHAFVIGVNDGVIPANPPESSLLSESDRLHLAKIGIELAPNLVKSQQDELFSIYTQLAAVKDSITFSYVNEADAQPSYLIGQLRQMFPSVALEEVIDRDIYDSLTTPEALFSDVLMQASTTKEQRYFQPIYNYFQQVAPHKLAFLKRALNYANDVKPMDEETTKLSYGEEIEASVSRIERFNQCEFAHFMAYGLGLSERKKYEITMPDMGNVYHEALKYISNLIKKDNRHFADLSEKECLTLATLGVERVYARFAFGILDASERMRVLRKKLEGVVYETLLNLARHGKRSAFKESQFELPFGRRPADIIKTEVEEINGFKFSLRGIIDRIDIAAGENKNYIRVVDYKSGKKDLDLASVYYGQSLQLLTYLDIAIKGAKNISDIGGALYFHVHRPTLLDHTELLTKENLKESLQEKAAKAYKMSGYLPENREVVALSDKALALEKDASDIVPVKYTAKGEFAKTGNRTLTEKDFKLLRSYANKKIKASVKAMVEGNIAINPVNEKGRIPCEYCAYKTVCNFEPAFNTFRKIPDLKPADALTKIKETLAEEADTSEE